MSIENIKARINYAGGADQSARMRADKLRSLQKALMYSYQSATIKLADKREFKCLINPDRLSMDLDNKILSIPFRGTRVNEEGGDEPEKPTSGPVWEDMSVLDNTTYSRTSPTMTTSFDIEELVEEDIDIKEGDIIEWKENGSHWIVYLRRLEETAYFRADIRRCRYQVALENGISYWAYVRGPVEQSLVWNQNGGNFINSLNQTIILYITQNEETLKYFSRFTKVTLQDKTWEIQTVDTISTPGIIELCLKEDFTNTPKTNIKLAVEKSIDIIDLKEQDTPQPYVFGLTEVDPYGTYLYEIKNFLPASGTWVISNESRKGSVEIIESNSATVKLNIVSGKRGSFTLYYKVNDSIVASLDVNIKSL